MSSRDEHKPTSWEIAGRALGDAPVTMPISNLSGNCVSQAKDIEIKGSQEWENLRAAFDRVKEFPEFQPDERARWLDLRQAVEKVLERGPKPPN